MNPGARAGVRARYLALLVPAVLLLGGCPFPVPPARPPGRLIPMKVSRILLVYCILPENAGSFWGVAKR